MVISWISQIIVGTCSDMLTVNPRTSGAVDATRVQQRLERHVCAEIQDVVACAFQHVGGQTQTKDVLLSRNRGHHHPLARARCCATRAPEDPRRDLVADRGRQMLRLLIALSLWVHVSVGGDPVSDGVDRRGVELAAGAAA